MKTELKRYNNFLNEEHGEEISQEIVECLPHLKKVNSEIPWQAVLDWFNQNDVDYYGMRDLDMYIFYIEKNS